MSQPYIGEIRLYPYNRGAPTGWQLCDGSLLQISEYEALFTLIGTTYGGDGQVNFAVPDLRGRVPIHQGTGPGLSTYVLGQKAGVEEVTLTTAQMPAHAHVLIASAAEGTSAVPTGNITASISKEPFYVQMDQGGGTPYPLPPATIGLTGGNGPHDNVAPMLALNYCISLYGIFPSQN